MTYDPHSLEGKLILVTGAGVGIGQGVALEVARQGADVAVHYSSSAGGALEAVQQIKAMGRRAIAIQGDLGVVAECRRVVDEAVAFLGGLDGLVNNAGITATIDFQVTFSLTALPTRISGLLGRQDWSTVGTKRLNLGEDTHEIKVPGM